MEKAIFIYFIFVNVVSFLVYTFDKFRSRVGASRVSEKELYTLSIIGGFLGATLSMVLFHHKIKKSSFLIKHIVILLVWIGATLYFFTQVDALNFLR